MAFLEDAAIVIAAMRRDPSFATVSPALIATVSRALWRAAQGPSRDGFLLAAMRLMALAGNGHSRVIPNGGISVLPIRIVARGDGWQPCCEARQFGRLTHIGGLPVERLFTRLRPWLAGTPARQRAIAGPLLAWPYALAAAGVRSDPSVYQMQNGARVSHWRRACVAASTLYPIPERGGDLPKEDPFPEPPATFVADGPLWLRLGGFSDLDLPDLDAVIARAAARIHSAPGPVVIDLRGNPGGSFLRAMPVVDALASHAHRAAILVDKHTFSAAIVFAVLVLHRMGDRARLFGEPMGDGLRFWAEGGTGSLPQTGAAVRWSDGWHDWETGNASRRAPPDLAPHMVAAGPVRIAPLSRLGDWIAGPMPSAR